jgi:hypothetical protein
MLDDRADTQQLHRLTQHADFLQRSLTVEAGARATGGASSSSDSSSPSSAASSIAADQASARMKELLAAKFAAFAEAAQVRLVHQSGVVGDAGFPNPSP